MRGDESPSAHTSWAVLTAQNGVAISISARLSRTPALNRQNSQRASVEPPQLALRVPTMQERLEEARGNGLF